MLDSSAHDRFVDLARTRLAAGAALDDVLDEFREHGLGKVDCIRVVQEAAGLSLGEDTLPSVLLGRRSQVHLELGWASVGQGDDSLAVLHLLEAERVAKQAVSRNATARALLRTLLARERKSATPGLRALAARAGAA